jgi:hypothetical protein
MTREDWILEGNLQVQSLTGDDGKKHEVVFGSEDVLPFAPSTACGKDGVNMADTDAYKLALLGNPRGNVEPGGKFRVCKPTTDGEFCVGRCYPDGDASEDSCWYKTASGKVCPWTDAPRCGAEGVYIQDTGRTKSGFCKCNAGYAGVACQYSDVANCSGNGAAQMDGTCKCNAGHAGDTCQYSDAVTCSGHGAAQTDGTCKCHPGFWGASCQLLTLTRAQQSGGYGADIVCDQPNSFVTQFCGSGENADCSGYTANHTSAYGILQCATSSVDLGRKSDKWIPTTSSYTMMCPVGTVLTGACVSGSGADCDGKFGKIRCTDYERLKPSNDAPGKVSGYFQTPVLGPGAVGVGVCNGGKNAGDCGGNFGNLFWRRYALDGQPLSRPDDPITRGLLPATLPGQK